MNTKKISARAFASVALVSFASACATPTRPPVSSAPQPARAPAVVARALAPRVTFARAGRGPLRSLGLSGDEARLFARDGRRYVLEGDRMRPLPGVMSAPIVAAARVGTDWLFASADGVVARSSGLEGALARVAEVPSMLASPPAEGVAPAEGVVPAYRSVSDGVLPLVAWPATRTLTVLDAQGRARRSDFALPVVESVFAGASLGVALLESGEVFCSADEGRSWSPLRGFGDRGIGLARRAGGVEVAGVRSVVSVGAACVAQSVARVAPVPQTLRAQPPVDLPRGPHAAGRVMMVAGECDAPVGGASRVWCRVGADGHRADVRLERTINAVGMVGDAFVGVTAETGEMATESVVAFDPVTGAEVPVAPVMQDARAHVAAAPSGVLYGVIGSGERRQVALGASVARVTVRDLPAGALGAGFIDARRGVAHGATAGALWHTRDGGASWEHLSMELDGDARTIDLDRWRTGHIPAEVPCDEDQCVVGGILRVRWGAAGEPTETQIARSAALADPSWVTSRRRTAQAGGPLFADVVAPDEAPTSALVSRTSTSAGAFAYVLLPGLVLRCEANGARCRWEGAQSAAFGLPVRRSFALTTRSQRSGDELALRFVAGGRDGVVLERVYEDAGSRYVFVGRDLRARWLEALGASALADRASGSEPEPFRQEPPPWLVRGDGIYTVAGFDAHGRHVEVIARYGFDGALRSVSPAILSERDSGWLAALGPSVGLLVPSATPGVLLFWGADGAAPVRVLRPWTVGEEVRFCEAPAADDEGVIVLTGSQGQSTGYGPSLTHLAWTAARTCIRSVWATPRRWSGGVDRTALSMFVGRDGSACTVQRRAGDSVERCR